MRIKKFSFITDNWTLEEITFDELNLLVGLNASGKSRTMSALTDIISLITEKGFYNMNFPLIDYTSIISIEDSNNEVLEYSVQVKGVTIINEKISVNNNICLDRTKGIAHLVNFNSESQFLGTMETINPPDNQLTMHIRRDTKAYPYFEKLIGWATGFYCIKFGNINNYASIKNPGMQSVIKPLLLNYVTGELSVLEMFEALSQSTRKDVIDHLNQMNFKVQSIKEYPLLKQFKTLSVVEEGVGLILSQQLSQGFYRSIYLLILLFYIKEKTPVYTLMIDDLCEGLDYQRSIELGKIVRSFCKNNNIQLIISSNDGFLMDIIDIKYWNVIQRDGKNVSSLNYHNSKELFDDFKFTGLSNLDFFTSNYLSKAKNNE